MRGGSAVCFYNANLWQAFTNIIDQTEPCSSGSLQ